MVGASPYGVRHRHHAPPRRCVHKHADKRLSHPTECDQAVTKLLDLLEEAAGGAPSLEESAQQRGARLRLTAEHEPAAQELLKRVRAAHAEYAVLLAAVGQLPTPDERSNAKEQLKVLAQPLTGGVAVMSTLVRCFTEAEAAGAAKAPKPRGKKRRHCDQQAFAPAARKGGHKHAPEVRCRWQRNAQDIRDPLQLRRQLRVGLACQQLLRPPL